MLLPVTPPFRKRRGRLPRRPASPVLVAAELTYGEGTDAFVRLTFDRAIDVAGLDAPQVTVDDAAGGGWAYAGAGVSSTPNPQTVVVALAQAGPAAPGPTALHATAATGIVAAGGAESGGAWAGVAGCALPYP